MLCRGRMAVNLFMMVEKRFKILKNFEENKEIV